MDTKKIWETALGELEIVLSKANFTTWFKGTFIYSYDQETGIVIIGVPSNFYKEWLEKKYKNEIFEVLKKLIPNLKKIEYKVSSQKLDIPESWNKEAQKSVIEKKSNDTNGMYQFNINEKYSFDKFIVGNSNRLAYAASMAVANKPGTAHNPLFIYGGVGLGKTHLVQAIANEIKKKNSKKKIIYVACEEFTNEFVQAISSGKINQFKKKYRDADLLLVDDIQFLAHKEGTQEEFFHTFNSLHQSNRQIVLTADRQPQALSDLTQRLTSRFAGGMVADIKSPNYETRIAILQAKSLEKNFPLNNDIIEYIAQHIESNIRELEGALNKIITQCELYNAKPSLDLVTKALEDMVNSKQQRVSAQKIMDTVCAFFSLDSKDILGKCRNKELVYPRQIIMYLMRNEMGYSFPKIGKELGGKDHTTIMHGVEKISKSLAKDNQLQKELALIKEKIYL